jgi:NADPH:quinone reductase-like Zn-dependent oxidoreductase
VIASAELVIPVPDALSDHDAAQAMINPVTALVLTTVEHRLRPGEWLAQTAAGSTVGRLALQLARSEGFRTLNLVRRSAQVAEIGALGGDLTLCTEDTDWQAQFVRAAESGPLEKAIDCVGGRVGAAVARGLQPGPAVVIGAETVSLLVPVLRPISSLRASASACVRKTRVPRSPCRLSYRAAKTSGRAVNRCPLSSATQSERGG